MTAHAAPTSDPFALVCTSKQRHETRGEAQIEANNKRQATGRRHKVEGCGICMGFHVYTATAPSQLKRANKRGQRRRGWTKGHAVSMGE